MSKRFLNTFVPPQPNPTVIALTTKINRWFILHGLPGLRSIPGLRSFWPGQGLAKVKTFDFPEEDLARLKQATSKEHVTFITPNHPEFFSDWMLDKEVCARVAPGVASWATHDIVNGIGPGMQKFWLANNLIAQIPGDAHTAKDYSISCAMKGAGVLLHPEGLVGWHSDTIGPIYPGAVDMALNAAELELNNDGGRTVQIAPVVWKLVFTEDVTPALSKELDYIEKKLGFSVPIAKKLTPAARVSRIYALLLRGTADALDLTPPPGGATYDVDFDRVMAHLLSRCLEDDVHTLRRAANAFAAEPRDDSLYPSQFEQGKLGFWRGRLRVAKALTSSGVVQPNKQVRDFMKIAQRLVRFHPEMYQGARMTQEQVAECIKRIRHDYCFGSWRDTMNRLVPIPAGRRIAHVRVPEPIKVAAVGGKREDFVRELHHSMQTKLDELRSEGSFVYFPNPFAKIL